jgi:hypothetical protein
MLGFIFVFQIERLEQRRRRARNPALQGRRKSKPPIQFSCRYSKSGEFTAMVILGLAVAVKINVGRERRLK